MRLKWLRDFNVWRRKKVHLEFLGNIVRNYSIGRFSIYVNVMVDGQHRMEIKQLMIYKNI